jgi:hypothetical protein
MERPPFMGYFSVAPLEQRNTISRLEAASAASQKAERLRNESERRLEYPVPLGNATGCIGQSPEGPAPLFQAAIVGHEPQGCTPWSGRKRTWDQDRAHPNR